MKKSALIISLFFVVFSLTSNLFAVPADKTITWEGSGQGQVVFEGDEHTETGLKCDACHPYGGTPAADQRKGLSGYGKQFHSNRHVYKSLKNDRQAHGCHRQFPKDRIGLMCHDHDAKQQQEVQKNQYQTSC